MAFNLQTFKTRALTAVIFVVVMLAGLFWSKWSFLILFSIIHFGCWLEYQKLVGLIDPVYTSIGTAHRYGIVFAGWGIMLSMAHEEMFIGATSVHDAGVLISLLGFATILFDLIRNFSTRPLQTLLYSILGLLYISLSWSCMIAIRNTEATFYDSSTPFKLPFIIPLILIASIWINDTMAYIVGSFIGKTPLSKVSPKKTWEGTIGGAILCIVTVTLAGYYLLKINDLTSLTAISAIAAVAGTLGDLLESKIKRMANVKDSGNLMPGHGGFLDRFDSLLLATPIACIYVFAFMVRFTVG
jgi:phosphatidate cytidylyltransferase